VVIPWVVYQFTGDTRIIEENYAGMAAWVNYMKNNSKDGIYAVDGYGDWVAVVPSPKLPLSAAYYYYDHVLMSKMAEILGKTDDARAFAAEAEQIAPRFHQRYWSPELQNYEGGTQTANLLPLAFGLVPDELVSKVVENIVNDVKQRDTHLSTGFIGTAYLLPILSQYGHHDLAYELAVQTTYPSWGYMPTKGATTIWELWNSDTEGPGMNSRNHFALGSAGEWYYSWLAGIRPQAGYKQMLIAPRPAGDLTWVTASVQTEYGSLRSAWKKDGDKLTFTVTIPANASAIVSCPATGANPVITESGKTLFDGQNPAEAVAGVVFKSRETDAVEFVVGAGTYTFVIE
jgi:alpha-L-rhamnosidase